MTQPCECPAPGFCPRHQMTKMFAVYDLCREDSPKSEQFRRLWDAQVAKKPGLLQQALSLGKAIVGHAIDGFRKVTNASYEARLEQCKSCDWLETERNKCKDCGCFVSVKAQMASEDCPQKKWPLPVVDTQERPVGGGCGGCGGRK